MHEPPREPYPPDQAGRAAAPPWGSGGPPAGSPRPPGTPPGGWRRAAPVGEAEPPGGGDRVVVHLVWEGVLLIVVVALLSLTLPDAHIVLSGLLSQLGFLGLLATGLALSLRTGTPNLAVGAIAVAAAGLVAHLVTEQGWSTPAAAIVGVALACGIGLTLGVLVALLSVPAWAATLGAAIVIETMCSWLAGHQVVHARFDGDYPTALWFGAFVVVSVGGGLVWLLPGVRRRLSATRGTGDPGRWGGMRSGLGAIVGLTGSSLLAGLSGVASLMYLQMAPLGTGLDTTVAAFAAVLVGGTSVFGRRAGVLGTLFAVGILLNVRFLLILHGVDASVVELVVGCLVVVGLGVSRALESITDAVNRPRSTGFVAPAGPPPPPFPGPPPSAPPPVYG